MASSRHWVSICGSQVIGCLLGDKQNDGAWKGLNLTYYGFFNATAYLFAAVLFFVLMGSLSIPVIGALAILTIILFFEILWGAAFLHTGRSRVTGATVRLHVVEGKI